MYSQSKNTDKDHMLQLLQSPENRPPWGSLQLFTPETKADDDQSPGIINEQELEDSRKSLQSTVHHHREGECTRDGH